MKTYDNYMESYKKDRDATEETRLAKLRHFSKAQNITCHIFNARAHDGIMPSLQKQFEKAQTSFETARSAAPEARAEAEKQLETARNARGNHAVIQNRLDRLSDLAHKALNRIRLGGGHDDSHDPAEPEVIRKQPKIPQGHI